MPRERPRCLAVHIGIHAAIGPSISGIVTLLTFAPCRSKVRTASITAAPTSFDAAREIFFVESDRQPFDAAPASRRVIFHRRMQRGGVRRIVACDYAQHICCVGHRSVIGPRWSSDSPSGKTPLRLTRPHVGFKPTIPLAADGSRIDPPVSLPIEPKHSPAAVAAPEPLDDAPGHRSAPHGFNGRESPDGTSQPRTPSYAACQAARPPPHRDARPASR